MYKLVVLFSVLALAKGSGLIAPLTYSSTFFAPATTSISKQFSSVIHPSPLTYSYGTPFQYAHYLKKRSVAPFLSTYSISTPLIHTTTPLIHSSPFLHSAPLLDTTSLVHSPLHFIKKRSVAPFYSTYSTYGSPLISAPLVHQAPLLHTTTPLIHSTPLIHTPYTRFLKKRSVAPVFSYLAPTSYSTQSRIDVHSSPLISTHSNFAPLTYSSHYPYTHFY